jgi:acyl-CoA synthetase (NDP forming)
MSIFSPEQFVTTMRLAAQADVIDVVLFHTNFSWGGRGDADTRVQDTVQNLVRARAVARKPIIVSIKPTLDPEGARLAAGFAAACAREGIPLFPGIDRAAKALAGMLHWRHLQGE